MQLRKISSSFDVPQDSAGSSMNICRSIGGSRVRALPPFVGCEQFWVDTSGSPPHPARGFSKITYLLSGKLKVEYSPPNIFTIEPQDVLSVMVGRGVRPKILSLDGTSTGINIWVDIPEMYKRKQPTSEFVCAKASTIFDYSEHVRVTVLSGSAFGRKAEHDLTLTPVTVLSVTVQPGGFIKYSIPDHWNAFIYVFDGKCIVNQELKAPARYYVEFRGRPCSDESDLPIMVQVNHSEEAACSFMLCAAEALDQPIYHQGPFVDVSSDWISQAYDDYNQHKNGFERHQMWNDHPD